MILVTGAAGYIGSHTAMALLQKGEEIVTIDNLSTGHIETIEKLKDFSDKFHFYRGDLTNAEDVELLFRQYKIDSVVHFAAFSIVSESVKEPHLYYRNNVFGSLNLFNTMIKNNVKKVVFSSTCAVYGEPVEIPISENHPKNPVNPYGNSKLVVEKILEDYDVAFGLKSIKLRYFNVAGAHSSALIGEWHDNETHLIPNILKSAIGKSEVFNIYGSDYDTNDGTCVRDYVNVEDLANAHVLALSYLEQNNSSEVFNIGTGNGCSVKEVFDTASGLVGREICFVIKPRRDGDPATLFADNSKAKKLLKWFPEKTLHDSISSAYAWEKVLQGSLSRL